MDRQFKRILDLVRRTGDRMVVTDTNGEDTYVVMGLEAYEALVDSQGMFDEGGFDDEPWSPPTEEAPLPEEAPPEVTLKEQAERDMRVWEAMKPAAAPGETWDLSKLTDEEKQEVEQAYRKMQADRQAAKPATEPPIQPVAPSVESPKAENPAQMKSEDDDEPGEEQFYLEPVE